MTFKEKITLSVDQDLYRRLQAAAQGQHTRVSTLARQALVEIAEQFEMDQEARLRRAREADEVARRVAIEASREAAKLKAAEDRAQAKLKAAEERAQRAEAKRQAAIRKDKALLAGKDALAAYAAHMRTCHRRQNDYMGFDSDLIRLKIADHYAQRARARHAEMREAILFTRKGHIAVTRIEALTDGADLWIKNEASSMARDLEHPGDATLHHST